MKLVTYMSNGQPTPGVIVGSEVSSLKALLPDAGLNSIIELIKMGPSIMEPLHEAIENKKGDWELFSESNCMAPIPHPQKNIICVGLNYKKHATEFTKSGFNSTSKEELPEHPIIFTKSPTSVIANNEAIDSKMDPTNSIDYEGELAVIIGKKGKHIMKDNAYDYVFGYTIINDVTSRITQKQHNQWFLGKSPDTFCPMGPTIVTSDSIEDVNDLELTTTVNGELRQQAKLIDLIFDIPTLLSTITKTMTLEPGDIIATGTPVGVGIGFNPPKYLSPGDSVAVKIEPIGTLTNTVK